MSNTDNDFDEIFDLYCDTFEKPPETSTAYEKPWSTFDELAEQMKEAIKTGIPIQVKERPPENPYLSMLADEPSLREALCKYWDKFHKMFPIGRDSPCDMTVEAIVKAVDAAIKSGVPLESVKPYDWTMF